MWGDRTIDKHPSFWKKSFSGMQGTRNKKGKEGDKQQKWLLYTVLSAPLHLPFPIEERRCGVVITFSHP